MRVTDLEKFSLEQIWRPYQNLVDGLPEERLMSPPYNLGDTARMLQEDNRWSRCVLDRISAIGVTFPAYINHPLVDLIKSEQAKRKEASR